MLLPYQVDVPMTRLPLANWALIAFTSLVSVAVLLGWQPSAAVTDDAWEDIQHAVNDKNDAQKKLDRIVEEIRRNLEEPLPGALNPRRFSGFQLFTSILVHADVFHLAFNMIFLFVFGNAVNAKLGHGWFLGLYFLLGTVDGITWLMLGDGRPAVGASGAIMGMVGIFFILFPKNDVQVFYWMMWVGVGTFAVSSVWLILFYLVSDWIGAVWFANSGIGYLCHLVGAFAGIIAGLLLLCFRVVQSTRYEENLLQVLGFQEKEPHYQDYYWAAKKKNKRPQVRG